MEFLRGVCQKDHDKNRVRLQAFQNPKSMLSPLHPTATHKDITNGCQWGKEENHLIDLTFPKINVQGVKKNTPLLFDEGQMSLMYMFVYDLSNIQLGKT